MNDLLRPTSLLVGLFFISICLCPQGKADSSTYDPLLKVKEFHSQFLCPMSFLDLGHVSPVSQIMAEKVLPGRPQEVGGLVALNNQKQRNLAFEGPLESGMRSNSMNVEVKGITVIAMNMVEGGNAVADSDIVLNPVQYIAAPMLSPNEEIGEKLR
jgi:hypothetical protein